MTNYLKSWQGGDEDILFRIFRLKPQQIIDALLFYDTHKGKFKMTREEAIGKTHGIGGNISTINALEALGLIKFEEPKDTKLNDAIGYSRRGSSYADSELFLARLKDCGYKIVKI